MVERMEWKGVRDAVHGEIELHPVCVGLLDTPEFQRLRNLAQCSVTSFVYPSACHSRFQHSLGVYHLAGVMVRRLVETGVTIEEEDKLCVEVAALCHDLGHGPFSHTWERFLHRTAGQHVKHEELTIELLKYLIEKNNLVELFNRFGLDENKRKFIDRLILGGPTPDLEDPDKTFLYEIVANSCTGLDVDKWDYMLRDALHFGVKTDLDYQRILSTVRVVKDPLTQHTHLAFRDKVVPCIVEMFELREKLHRVCYQHRVSKVAEIMLIDALVLMDDFYRVKLENGKELKLSECHKDPEAYTRISDYIYHVLLFSTQPELKPGRQILEDLVRRRFYKTVCLLKIQRDLDEKEVGEFERKLGALFGKRLMLAVIDASNDSAKLKNIYIYDKEQQLIPFPGELKPSQKEVILICAEESDPELNKKMKEELSRMLAAERVET